MFGVVSSLARFGTEPHIVILHIVPWGSGRIDTLWPAVDEASDSWGHNACILSVGNDVMTHDT